MWLDLNGDIREMLVAKVLVFQRNWKSAFFH